VHVAIDSPDLEEGTYLFEAGLPGLGGQRGIAAALVELQPEQGGATLLLANKGMEPVLLDEGEVLGILC
jgi:hypothetical protein